MPLPPLRGLFVTLLLGGTALFAQAPKEDPSAGMARIPGGEFWMGRTRLWLMDEIGWQLRDRADDRPLHRVVLPPFLLDTHEVTNADYAEIVEKKAAQPPYHWNGRVPPGGNGRLPIYNVSWDEASNYCKARGKRLPTEAEWERAARGGAEDLDYPWGNEYTGEPGSEGGRPVRRAHSDSATGPVPVGSFAANGYGLYDMSGNVWEWVADWYDLYYYSVSPTENPQGPVPREPTGPGVAGSALYKVLRGGGWADAETRYGTVYFRNFTQPDTRQPTIGFRCARSQSAS